MDAYHCTFDPSTKTWSGRPLPAVFHPNANVGHIILDTLARSPNKIGQITVQNGLEMRNRDIQINTIRVAQNFVRLGLRSGAIVAIAAGNHHHLASVVFGLLSLAAPVHILDPEFKTFEFVHMLGMSKPNIVICESYNYASVSKACLELGLTIPIYLFGDERQDGGASSVDELLRPTFIESDFVPTPLTDGHSQIALIVCSSGTTGLSKGVNISHATLLSRHYTTFDAKSEDVFFGSSALYWIAAVMTLFAATLNGATRILTNRPVNPELLLGILEKYRVTALFLPTTVVMKLLECPSSRSTDLSSIERLYVGGSAVPKSMEHQVNRLLPNGRFSMIYGMSEMAGYVMLNTHRNASKTIGRLGQGVRMRVANETGELCGPNENGEILIFSDPPILGYLNDEGRTRAALDSSGWFRSGDIGRFDDDHVVHIVDRIKDIIPYYGKVSPTEVESVVLGVSGVSAVCVVGLPVFGVQQLPAAIVIKNGLEPRANLEADIHAAIEEKLNDQCKLRGGIYFVDELPKTTSGKVLRREVIEIATAFYYERRDGQTRL